MNLSWGQWIIDRLKLMPENGRYILIIRHSERVSFDGIPIEQWNSVGITERGKQAAFEFGRALIDEVGLESVYTEGWGLERCADTAAKIFEGASASGCRNCKFSKTSYLESPIADHDGYMNLLKSGKWNEILVEWLSSPSDGWPMKPYAAYSENILREVLKNSTPATNSAGIIVTHDLHIFPIITANFGLVKLDLDFMDGILISKTDSDTRIFHRDLTSTMSDI